MLGRQTKTIHNIIITFLKDTSVDQQIKKVFLKFNFLQLVRKNSNHKYFKNFLFIATYFSTKNFNFTN